jgi:ubiquinone/menaquinone biosynthesis C-methylase UbiE
MDEDREAYVLGHQDDELQRLIEQSRYLGDLTKDVLQRGGLTRGMRVLDVGCGAGDVSFLAASLVGPTGSVIGIDRSPEAVALARKRAADAGLANVTFQMSDLENLTLDRKVDALIGRLVLLYMKDPADCLSRWASHVETAGIVVFHEMVMMALRSLPPVPSYDNACTRIAETFRRSGADLEMGMKLYSTFLAAGLPPPQMIMGGRIGGGPDIPAYSYIAEIVRSLLPAMERFGIWTAAEAGIDTLAQRMRDEAVRGGGVVATPPLVGAWCRKL